MSKKRNPKKRKKNPKPSADFVEKKLLNIFNKQINKVFSTKQLLKKLNLANSIDAINSALEKLDKAGKIKTSEFLRYHHVRHFGICVQG